VANVNIADVLWAERTDDADRPALRVGDRSWTRDEVAAWAELFAGRLTDAGVTPGDRVLLAAPTSVEFVVAYHAVLAVGAVVVTVNPMCTSPELEYYLEDAGCVLALGWTATATALLEAAERQRVPLVMVDGPVEGPRRHLTLPVLRESGDLAVLLYTSGTTGRPKGAELTHGSLRVSAEAVSERLEITSEDRIGTSLPLFHVYGQGVVMGAALRCGATLSLQHPFRAEAVLRMISDHELTVMAGVPTMWVDLVHQAGRATGEHVGDLRVALSGGAPLPAEVARALREGFGCALVEGYGLSEATGVATMGAANGLGPEGSVGRALPGVDVQVLGEDGRPVPPGTIGEIAVRGPVLMRGYWKRPEATAEVRSGEWLLTGDIGHEDADGNLWIVDRKKDLIIRGGYNVYPREIEEQLYEHPAIREAAVIGVPDERLGEEVAAVIALRPGTELRPEDLRGWLSNRLAGYKVPRLYRVVPTLPKGTTGKILKRSIDPLDVRATGTHVSTRPPSRPMT
jgi:long-chain acyl-CoA synthetase